VDGGDYFDQLQTTERSSIGPTHPRPSTPWTRDAAAEQCSPSTTYLCKRLSEYFSVCKKLVQIILLFQFWF
jgi:hypothetical protein